MKKFIAVLLAFVLIFSSSFVTFAKNEEQLQVIVPNYSIQIGDGSVYHFDSIYPFLSYKDITYFPMTFEYCRALGIVTHWSEEDGLYVAKADVDSILPIYEYADNSQELCATLPDYDIYVNGRKIINSEEEYPVLNFRYVTYFPMTYDFISELGLSLDFSPERLRIIRKSNIMSAYFHSKKENELVVRTDSWEYKKGNSFTSDYCKINLDTFEISDIAVPDKESPTIVMFEDFTYEAASEVTEKDGKYFVDDMEIPDLNFEIFKENNHHENAEYTLYASKRISEHITFYELTMRATYPVSATQAGTQMQYCEDYVTYIKIADKLTRCFPNTVPDSVEKCNNNLFFTARKFVKTIGRHYSDQAMLYWLPENKTEPISLTMKYKISHAELLGTHDGKLYFKACFGYPMSGHEIKPHLDGYYTFDGENLVKIANYAGVDYEILKEDGSLYGIDFYQKKLIKLN